MAVTGIQRYKKLVQNIKNWQEYVINKKERRLRSLQFITKPYPITFKVPQSLYHVFKEIFLEDFYDINSLIKKLPTKPLVLDIGANAGFFDILLFSKLPDATIYAYEPLPSNIFLLKETIANNLHLQKNLYLFQQAVTGIPQKEIELFIEGTESNSVVASVFSNFDERNTQRLLVPALSLTQIIEENNFASIDLLKLDCEGSEYTILYNTNATALKKIKIMVIEVHEIDQERNNICFLSDFLKDQGFKISTTKITNASYYLEAVKK